MEQIIIVEDDEALGAGLCKALKNKERSICLCSTIEAAEAQISCCEPALMILDVNLPDGNGLDFLKKLRNDGYCTPVIILTANDTDMDIVKGLEDGADDYITKPFSLAVLRARVDTQLRRMSPVKASENVIVIDDYRLDFGRMEYFRGDEKVELSKTEQKLLKLLVENMDITLTRAALIDRIWTDGSEYVDENALSVSVKRLRDKLHASEYIKTVYGIGYVWRRRDG